MILSTRAALVLALMASGASACNRQLPPAATPAATRPQLAELPPTVQGQGQLIIDVVDAPTAVQRVEMQATPVADEVGRTRYEFVEAPQALCEATPCVVSLPVGSVLLRFPTLGGSGATEDELVYVDPEPTVYRRRLTYWKPREGGGRRALGIVSLSLGGMSAVTGAALLPIGLADDSTGMTVAGSITLGVGALLVAVGTLAVRGTGSTYQPGSAIHFSF